MGENLPGNFADPVYVRSAKVRLKASQTGSAGGYVRYDAAAATPAWEVLTAALIGKNGASVQGGGLGQLQQDVNTAGTQDAAAGASIFGPGSWFYGYANADLEPFDLVTLTRRGTQFGWEPTRNISATAATIAANVVTVTCATSHHLREGNTVTLEGFAPAAFNAEVTVASVTSATVFTADLTAANGTATTAGIAKTPATGEFAHAQYIKEDGATFTEGAAANAVCVLSMLKGGQPVE